MVLFSFKLLPLIKLAFPENKLLLLKQLILTFCFWKFVIFKLLLLLSIIAFSVEKLSKLAKVELLITFVCEITFLYFSNVEFTINSISFWFKYDLKISWDEIASWIIFSKVSFSILFVWGFENNLKHNSDCDTDFPFSKTLKNFKNSRKLIQLSLFWSNV